MDRRELSAHAVAIRSPRADILLAAQREYGTLFSYWRVGEEEMPDDVANASGVALVIADDVLLPTGKIVRL